VQQAQVATWLGQDLFDAVEVLLQLPGYIQTFTKSKNREEGMMPRAFVVKALDDGWTIPGVFEG